MVSTEYSVEQIEQILRRYLPPEEGLQKTILEAMNYSVLAGGKRIRPRLMGEAFRLFDGEGDVVEPFMAAMEMIHTYSLVHDDLPAMDNDTLRRGKPTTWSKYGEDMGILAGDCLLTYAFETAAKAFTRTEDAGRVGQALGILAEKAGIYGMAGGQVVDVEKTGQPVSAEELDFIYRLKTGALLEASLMIGAVLAGADAGQVKTMEKIGTDVGLAFQIRDDILDVISSEAELGKPIGSDERNAKTTYVTLYGLEAAQREVARCSAEAVELLGQLPGDTSFFKAFIEKLEQRRN
ncbi:MAG: polyprenyl synthetase family protein [Lachnospiraceae bacterium]|nr:polyprenyl synthetase family protein [Lachnospiraceae bacterium]